MKLSWHFRKVDPRFKNREATQGEFFASDTDLRAFIREAIQNSLDARRPGFRGAVAVRIFLSGDKSALDPETAKRYFRGGWDHFQADGSGLREAPDRSEPCRFITIEDSGTTGLTGDTTQFHEVAGARNPFYYFFRAEGQSNKLETGRGRWGLGKFVFPRSSRVRSFFAVTTRHDDHRRLLVGQSILRSHVIDDKSYTPDGWFGDKPDKGEAFEPVEQPDFIDRFEQDFCLERKREPGLSIVIPFCDSTWTAADVIRHVVQDYYFPILREELVVTVEDVGSGVVLNAQSLPEQAVLAEESMTRDLPSLLKLSQWAIAQQRAGAVDQSLVRAALKNPPRFSRELLDADELSAMKRRYHAGEPLAVRIPVQVQVRSGPVRSSAFDVFLQQAPGTNQKHAVFIRDGLMISDVRSRPLRDALAILTVDDAPLTAFLGDAENPAHTEWHEESSHFKGKYVHGPATLRFIRNAAADLVQLLIDTPDGDDSVLLLDVFSVGTAALDGGHPVDFAAMSSGTRSSSLAQLKRLTPRKSRSRTFQIGRRVGGFRVAGRTALASESDAMTPISVSVAYDRRTGSPLRNYAETDFRLDARPITIQAVHARVEFPAPNRLLISPTAADFSVVVRGFDVNRDLFLHATSMVPALKRSRVREAAGRE